MTVRELLSQLSALHPDSEVMIETTFKHDAPSRILSTLPCNNMIVLRDHVVTTGTRDVVRLYDGNDYEIPFRNERNMCYDHR